MIQTGLDDLREHLQSITPEDSMAEAGRKILLAEFIKMLSHEAGSRTGDDIEDVHQMRVATRRMRSAFQLLGDYYRPHKGNPYGKALREVARRLGRVRDLDVMIDDLQRYQQTQDKTGAAALQVVISWLDENRQKARKKLNKHLDSKSYRTFVESFGKYLSKPSNAPALHTGDNVEPFQVRHLLPDLIYTLVAAVRAYDAVLEQAVAEQHIDTLHALRIEFKRLRYAVTFFEGVMGTQHANQFIKELKVIQDQLGRINDIHVAHDQLLALVNTGEFAPEQRAVLEGYLQALEEELPQRIEQFPETWLHFNTKTVQRKLANAVVL